VNVRVAALLVGIFGGTLLVSPASAQELACRVQIDDSQISGSESALDFLDALEQKIQEYMNTTEWTDDQFLPHERITCSMQIVLQEATSLTTFEARLILTTRRPIYGTAQSTRVLRVNDDNWRFEFSRGTSLRFNLDRYNALTSVLDFYAYVMLGYDYDTFSELGGSPYFNEARDIADRARGNGDPGWSSTAAGDQNRAQLIRELEQSRHQAFRRALYQYHLEGLDRFVSDPAAARGAALEALTSIREVRADAPNSYALDLFFSAKSNELTALFQDGEQADRAYSVLTQVDPSRSSDYNELVQ